MRTSLCTIAPAPCIWQELERGEEDAIEASMGEAHLVVHEPRVKVLPARACNTSFDALLSALACAQLPHLVWQPCTGHLPASALFPREMPCNREMKSAVHAPMTAEHGVHACAAPRWT
jgi:hypothetical protein